MGIRADTHLFGSRTGYECLAKSRGVSAAEDRLLSEFGFGQSSDERFLRGLVASPTAFARPVPGGRFAITRVLAGPLDDGGRPTLERRTILLAPSDYQALRRSLPVLLLNQRLWSSAEFASGAPVSIEVPAGARRPPAARTWLVFDAWVSARSRPPHGVVVGSGDEASEAVLSAVACLADEDAMAFSWGIRLLSPIAWVDVMSLSPFGSLDGRRPVFGVSTSGCVNPAVESARGVAPGALPSLAAIRSWGREPDADGQAGGSRVRRKASASDLPDGTALRRTLVVTGAVLALCVCVLGATWAFGRWGSSGRGGQSVVRGPIDSVDTPLSDGSRGGQPSDPVPTPRESPVPPPTLATPAPTPTPTMAPPPAAESEAAKPAPADAAPPPADAASPPAVQPPSGADIEAPRLKVQPPVLASEGTTEPPGGAAPEATPAASSGFDLSDQHYRMLLDTLHWTARICETDIAILRTFGEGQAPAPDSLRGLIDRAQQLEPRGNRARQSLDQQDRDRQKQLEQVQTDIYAACERIVELGKQRKLRNDRLPIVPPNDASLPELFDELGKLVADPKADRARLVTVVMEVSLQLFVARQIGGKPMAAKDRTPAIVEPLSRAGCAPEKIRECQEAVAEAAEDLKGLLGHRPVLEPTESQKWVAGRLGSWPKDLRAGLDPKDPDFPKNLLSAVVDRALQQDPKSDRFGKMLQYIFESLDKWPAPCGAPPFDVGAASP